MFRKNVDSGVKVPANIWDKVGGRLKYLATPITNVPIYLINLANLPMLIGGEVLMYYRNVPIYLVNPSTMDKIKPPETGYDPECVKRSMAKVSDVINRDWEEILSKCKRITYHTVGVYTEDSPTIREYTSEKETRAIFICPERIYNQTHSKPDIVFQFVVIHELAHAYQGMCKYYTKDWEKVIEESLANAVAYVNFEKTEKNAILEHISQQPCEYKGYTFWTSLSRDSEPRILLLWLNFWRWHLPFYSPISIYYRVRYEYFRDYQEGINGERNGIWTNIYVFLHKCIEDKNPEHFYKLLAMEILRAGTA